MLIFFLAENCVKRPTFEGTIAYTIKRLSSKVLYSTIINSWKYFEKCCGHDQYCVSATIFVSCERFVKQFNRRTKISIYNENISFPVVQFPRTKSLYFTVVAVQPPVIKY